MAAGERVLAAREINNGYTHAENLHVFIDQVLKEANLTLKELSAVAVSKGPGSYTGLRIGVSAAKGFCYTLKIPLISVDTLAAMASSAVSTLNKDILYCPMLDARRMEVYCAVYDKNGQAVMPVNALILDENSIAAFNLSKPVCFFGEGMPKARTLLEKIPGALFLENINPSAPAMLPAALQKLAAKKFEDLALFEPFYLKEFFIKPKG